VVWFGESLPQKEWSLAERAALACDLFLSVGTQRL
jgi:NAD-dependent deacetylase